MRPRDRFAFCVVALIWGTTWLAIRVVVREMPPLTTAAARFAIASLLLVGVARWRKTSLAWRRFEPAERRLLLVLSVVMFAIPYGLVFYAEQYVSSALTAILFSSHLAFVVLFESLWVRRNLFHGFRLWGLVLALGGVVVIFLPRLQASSSELRGVLAVLGVAVFSGWAVVLAKYKAHGIDPVAGTTWQMAGGALWLLAVGWTLERPGWTVYSAEAYGALAYLIVCGSCVTFVLYYSLLKRMEPVQISTLVVIEPIIAVLAGRLVLGETLGRTSILGAVLVLLGVYLLHREEPAMPSAGD